MDAAQEESGGVPEWRRLVATTFVIQFCSMMGVSAVYAFLPLYIESLGIESESQAVFWAGLLMFCQAMMVALASPIWGSMADRHGAKLMLIRALLGGGVIWVAISFANSVYQLIPLFMLAGALSGINTAMTNLVSGAVPRHHLGRAIGTVQTGVFTGAAIGPLVGGVVADQFSYRIAIRFGACLIVGAGALVIFLIHENARPGKSGAKRPGFLEGIRQTSQSRALMLLFGMIFLIQFASQMVTPAMPVFIRQIAGDPDNVATTIGIVLAIGGVGSAIGAIVMGRLADRFGQLRLLRIATVGSAVAFGLQALTWAVAPLAAARGVAGFFMGGLNTSVNANVGAIAPTANRGAAFGVAGSAFSFGNALGPLLGGVITGILSPRAVIFIAAGILLIGRLLVALLDRTVTTSVSGVEGSAD